MSLRTITRLLLLLVFLPACFLGQATEKAQQVPARPASPVVAEQLPPAPPRVVCAGDRVSVQTENSTLRDVVRAIAACTGAKVDMPGAVGMRRVAARLGPAKTAEALAVLLDGSLDYIMLESKQDPAQLQLVMIRQRNSTSLVRDGSATGSTGATAVRAPANAPATFVDQDGVVRLRSGLTPEEAVMTPEELVQQYEKAREEQLLQEKAPDRQQQ
jgi:hypothetical protein